MSDFKITKALREDFVAKHPLKSELQRMGVKIIGDGDRVKCHCPFHDDKNPSFSADFSEGVWQCFAGCGAGGVVELAARHQGKTTDYVLIEYAKASGQYENNGKNGSHEKPVVHPPVNWPECVEAFGEAHQKRLAEWRGYSSKFVAQLVEHRMVGMCEGNLAFPIFAGGKVIGTHQRIQSGGWIIRGGQGTPWVIGDHFENVMIFESQWDAFAFMDAIDWFKSPLRAVAAIVITRGAAKGKAI